MVMGLGVVRLAAVEVAGGGGAAACAQESGAAAGVGACTATG